MDGKLYGSAMAASFQFDRHLKLMQLWLTGFSQRKASDVLFRKYYVDDMLSKNVLSLLSAMSATEDHPGSDYPSRKAVGDTIFK